MPLDLKKVINQFKSLEGQESANTLEKRLDSTYKIFQHACEDKHRLVTRLLETERSLKANFFFGMPTQLPENENLDKLIEPEKNFSKPHITIATDGSQMNPSSHELSGAFLINIGLVCIPYFATNIPVTLSSEPTVYSSLEELKLPYQKVLEEDLISYERTLKEMEELLKAAKKYIANKIPVVALLDGTLIHWHLEKFSSVYVEQFVKRFSDVMLELKSMGVPVASFLSNSRSNDLVNMLRIYKCPYEEVDCKKYCTNIDSNNLPCNPCLDYKPVLDRRVVEKLFTDKKVETGTRTLLFKSNNKVLDYYPDDLKVHFFYINTGTEIARVELPFYVSRNNQMLDLLHNAVALQCKVGFGYPVVLSEAHLLAVVNKTDRQVFYDLLKEELLKKSEGPVRLSSKELKKRISFV